MSQSKKFKKKAEVFDLDGTLADIHDYEAKHKKRHEDFAQDAEKAPEIKRNVERLEKAHKKGTETIILTARSEHYEKETDDWIKKHHIPVDKLLMRPKSDTKDSDKKVKEKILEKDIEGKYKVKKAYDDKHKNVKMFRKHGIKAKEV